MAHKIHVIEVSRGLMSEPRIRDIVVDELSNNPTVVAAAQDAAAAAVDANPVIATHTAAIANLTNRFDPRDYGTVGSGNDTAAIQAAIDAAEAEAASTGVRQTVYLAPRLWTLATPHGVYIESSRVWVEMADGAEIYAPNLIAGTEIIRIRGTRDIGVTTLTANVTKGQSSITVADASGLAVGDWIALYSGETFNPDRAEYTKGEYADIAAISGTTVTLAGPIRDTYDNATYPVTVDVITPLVDVGVRGGVVRGTSVNDAHGIRAEYCLGLTFDGVTSIDNHWSGLQAAASRNVRMMDCNAKGSDQTGVGYGFMTFSCDGVKMRDCHGERNRHTVDISSWYNFVPGRNASVKGCSAVRDSSGGMSSHGGCDYTLFEGCWTVACGGGFVARGSNTTLRDCTVNGIHQGAESYRHGIQIGDGAPHPWGNGIAGTGLVIENCTVDVSGWSTLSDTRGMECTAPLVNARIVGNHFKGFGTHGLRFMGTTIRESVIKENIIDCTSTLGDPWLVGILVKPPSADGNNQHGLRIEKNRVINCSGNAIRVEGNSVDSANRSSRIKIIDNDVTTYGVRGIDLTVGWFRDVEIVLGYCATFAGAVAVISAANFGSITVDAIGTGSPESVVPGGPGSTYRRADGATSTSFYVKQTGITTITGWVGK